MLPDYCRVLKITGSNGEVKEVVFPKALDLDRPKRPRTTFSTLQLAILEREFQLNPYLIGSERVKLSTQLDLSEIQVKVWFQNRRSKNKRKSNNNNTQQQIVCSNQIIGTSNDHQQHSCSIQSSASNLFASLPPNYCYSSAAAAAAAYYSSIYQQ